MFRRSQTNQEEGMMRHFSGVVELRDTGRVRFPVNINASSFPVACGRAAWEAIHLYRLNRSHQRVHITSINIELAERQEL